MIIIAAEGINVVFIKQFIDKIKPSTTHLIRFGFSRVLINCRYASNEKISRNISILNSMNANNKKVGDVTKINKAKYRKELSKSNFLYSSSVKSIAINVAAAKLTLSRYTEENLHKKAKNISAR